mmetsp:Transcript_29885/g.56033  ORF Transcript_29885/g.56033 Transcript_29885/m.56033 type:complete len:92 (-) Transcript_29885:203-478(-)
MLKEADVAKTQKTHDGAAAQIKSLPLLKELLDEKVTGPGRQEPGQTTGGDRIPIAPPLEGLRATACFATQSLHAAPPTARQQLSLLLLPLP